MGHVGATTQARESDKFLVAETLVHPGGPSADSSMNRQWVCLGGFRGAGVPVSGPQPGGRRFHRRLRMGGGESKGGGSEGQSFDEVVKDTAKSSGFSTCATRRRSRCAARGFRPEQLDHDFILSATQETGIGARRSTLGAAQRAATYAVPRGGQPHPRRETQPDVPHRRGPPGGPDARSTTTATRPSPPLRSRANPTRIASRLVNAADLFLKDLAGVGPHVERVLDEQLPA